MVSAEITQESAGRLGLIFSELWYVEQWVSECESSSSAHACVWAISRGAGSVAEVETPRVSHELTTVQRPGAQR